MSAVFELRKAAEFQARINSWRLQVAACVPTPEWSSSPPPTRSREGSTRRRNIESLKPYSKPIAQQPHRNTQMLYYSSFQTPAPLIEDEDFPSRRCRTPSLFTDTKGLRLPHPHHNPLIPDTPDDLEEEYCRLVIISTRLTADMQRAQHQTNHLNAERNKPYIIDTGAAILSILDAMDYCEAYSRNRNWTIDFQTLAHRRNHGMGKPSPSYMRDLQCQSMFIEEPIPAAAWHLYPAA
ncbi:hypothetical protein CPB83DRAFT_834545 [Crepidotus variabilis]|uniref:Uncharacterized protein n=1 Tax=Crepidotus variabilis TaxID=179855 RepID=A0A9P6EIH2_9AGAR|nr:hypothetical protein CPB83DRAFT_834545 [Crepidotus variabilis]